MPKFKLSDWAHISEIGASIVVVLSLIYVGLQINQNTVALQQETYQSVQEILHNVDMTLATDSELLEVVMLAETSPSKASPLQWRKFTHLAFPQFATWEFIFLARQAGAFSEDQWTAIDPYFSVIMCKAGYTRFWRENKPVFAPSFAKHVETVFASRCVVS